MKPLLQTKDLRVGYTATFLPPISFEVRPGEIWAVIGPNGAGKSTLLRTLLGLQKPLGGGLERSPQLRVGYVPQRLGLDPEIPARVQDVVDSGLDRGWQFLNPLHGWRNRRRVRDAMHETQVDALARQSFSTLSEGQKQRVMVARAIVALPNLVVLDEPTSAMDMVAERRAFELVVELAERHDLAVVVVSHQLRVLRGFATHAIYLDREHGVIDIGSFETVCQNPRCVERFGDLLGAGHG